MVWSKLTSDAWVAGLFEGEGYIGCPGKLGARVAVTSTDRDVIERLNNHYPGRIQSLKPRAKHHKVPYRWSLEKGIKVRVFLNAIVDFLGERRRARAMEALERLEKRLDYCKNGHKRTTENTYYHKGKARFCRECRQAYAKEYETTRAPRSGRIRKQKAKGYPSNDQATPTTAD